MFRGPMPRCSADLWQSIECGIADKIRPTALRQGDRADAWRLLGYEARNCSVGENARSDEEKRRPRKGWPCDPTSCARMNPSAEQRQKRPFRLAIRRLVRIIAKPEWLVFGEQDWTTLE